MAYGIIQLISNNGHAQVYIPSGTQYASIGVLNPNDGVAYVAANRDVLNNQYGSWDWKIPSQSYALLPGPFLSVGIYYTDQSGAAHNGEITIYGEYQTISIPTFQAVGRAIVALQSTLDVTQGAQPANPGVGITRVWADTNGNLHRLLSNGNDATIIDTSNYATLITLVGDVTGAIGNTVQTLRNTSAIWYQDSGGTYRQAILISGPNILYWAVGNGAFRWVNQGNTVEWMRLDAGGVLTIPGNFNSSDLHSNRANDTGVLYLGNSNSHYLYFDGATFQVTNNTAIAGTLSSNQLNVTGNILLSGAVVSSIYGYIVQANSSVNSALYWDAAICQITQASAQPRFRFATQAGPNYVDLWLPINGAVYPGGNQLNWNFPAQVCAGNVYNAGANGNGFFAPNSNPLGVGLAQAWSTYSSLIHAEEYALRVEPVSDPMAKVLAIQGYSYDHLNFDSEDTPQRQDDGTLNTDPLFGFDPREVHAVLPELVDMDSKGNPAYLDLDRMLVILWEAVKELDARIPKAA